MEVRIFGRPIKCSPLTLTVNAHHSPEWQYDGRLLQPVRVCCAAASLEPTVGKGEEPPASPGPVNLLYILDTGNNRGEAMSDF